MPGSIPRSSPRPSARSGSSSTTTSRRSRTPSTSTRSRPWASISRASTAAAPEHDLSDRGSELKSTVHESLRLFIDSSHSMHDLFAHVRDNVEQTTHAMNGIAAASGEVAQGAERQAMMLQRSRELADEVSAATRPCPGAERAGRRGGRRGERGDAARPGLGPGGAGRDRRARPQVERDRRHPRDDHRHRQPDEPAGAQRRDRGRPRRRARPRLRRRGRGGPQAGRGVRRIGDHDRRARQGDPAGDRPRGQPRPAGRPARRPRRRALRAAPSRRSPRSATRSPPSPRASAA